MYYFHIIKLRLLSDLLDIADWYNVNINVATKRLGERWREQQWLVNTYHDDAPPRR